LHYFIVAFPEVKVEVDEIQRINPREIEVPALAFRGAICHGHAQVEQGSFDEVSLLRHLHFNYETIPFGILAVYVEDGISVILGFALDIRVVDAYCFYRVRKLFFEESVEQGDKQVAVFFACECFFESQVERELGIATLRRKLVFVNVFVFWHKASCKVKMKPEYHIIKAGDGATMCYAITPHITKNWNIENFYREEAA
jgi:hypothetical protein